MSNSVLSLQDVTIYQEQKVILSEVNLTVNHGEFIYIIGKTGSGKSSLMKTLYADLPLTEGQGSIVSYDLRNIKEDDIPYLRRKIGIVFQDFKLLPDRSIKENMLFVLKATGWTSEPEMLEKIDEVLDKVDLKSIANKMPHQLSGGEQQRVAIARALLNDPELISALVFLLCVGPATICFHLLTENSYTFLMLLFLFFWDRYQNSKRYLFLSIGLSVLLFSMLVKPGSKFLAVLVLVYAIKIIYQHRKSKSTWIIYGAMALIALQLGGMKAQFGNATLSYIDGITYHNYLCTKAVCYQEGVPYHQINNERAAYLH